MNHLQKSQPVHGRTPDLPHCPAAKPMLAAMAQGRVGPGGFPGSSILTKRQDGTQVDKQRLKGIFKINKQIKNLYLSLQKRQECVGRVK